jgi:hypothetical protein
MSNLGKYLAAAAWFGVAAGLFGSNPSARDIDRLIEQLGSNKFLKRERASQTLQAIGVRALPALHKAAEAADPEVRRRARLLLAVLDPKEPGEEQAERIRNSRLPPQEKGRQLRALLKLGMTRAQVVRLLGGPGEVPWRGGPRSPLWVEAYSCYELEVGYFRNRLQYTSQSDDW